MNGFVGLIGLFAVYALYICEYYRETPEAEFIPIPPELKV